MFQYRGCVGRRVGHAWLITYEDGTADAAHALSVALRLCEGSILRSSR